jgi:4,5-dihydroxyphthalate decarboxylase
VSDAVHHLKVGMAASDRMLALATGEITSTELSLDFETGTPSTLFWRALHDGAFDATEMSLAAHAILTSRNMNPFVGLPIFTSRMFRHGSIFVSDASAIEAPAELAGKRVGIPEYQMTAAVWMRGILQDRYGVLPRDIRWRTGGVNKPGRSERIELRQPTGVQIDPIGDQETLDTLLLAGEIDAIMAPQVPASFRRGDKRVRRLFDEARREEEAYFADSGIFPIMHLLVMRRERSAKDPELAGLLFDLFERAKAHALETLADADAPYVMMPWQVDEIERTSALMGADYWPYGIEANMTTLETFVRYLGEQELLERRIRPQDLFAHCNNF